ncbi:hypothetical protein Nepgr_007746 [Nepenthes gracilis]|uniref:Secreted protein n=1 Tax=Nepenthes gracilis TaxID=150966 RepID=A0AAD3S7V4_NEPGR|nr:hypothetical protein Nepgr_007746 [Nepenthes gracilis]
MLYTWVSALLGGASEARAVEWQFAGCLQMVSSADLGESSAEAGSGCTSSELTKCCLSCTARCSCTIDACVSAYV